MAREVVCWGREFMVGGIMHLHGGTMHLEFVQTRDSFFLFCSFTTLCW
jgi:hypothetical protein